MKIMKPVVYQQVRDEEEVQVLLEVREQRLHRQNQVMVVLVYIFQNTQHLVVTHLDGLLVVEVEVLYILIHL